MHDTTTDHPFHPTTNTLYPHQPNYQPPDYRVDPEHHFPLTAPAAKVDGTAVEKSLAAMENAATQFEKHLGTVDVEVYTNEGARQRINEFTRTDAAKAVDQAIDQVRERRDRAAARVEHLKRELSPAGDTATELRNTRFWDRTQKILDSISDHNRLHTIAEELITQADRTELGVLLQELTPYMRARIEQFNAAPDRKQRILDGYTTAIEDATAKAVPEYSKAKRQLSQAEKAFQVTEHNARSMRQQFEISAPAAYRRPRFIDARKYDPDAQ